MIPSWYEDLVRLRGLAIDRVDLPSGLLVTFIVYTVPFMIVLILKVVLLLVRFRLGKFLGFRCLKVFWVRLGGEVTSRLVR